MFGCRTNGIGLTRSTNESTMEGFLTSAYHSYSSKPANHTLSSDSLSDPPSAGEQPPSSSSYDYYSQDHQQQHPPPTHHLGNPQSNAPSPDLATRAADQITQENALDEEPLYVNAKQYYRILKRRVARARLEEVHRLSKQRKVHPSPLFFGSNVDSHKALSSRIASSTCDETTPRPWRSLFDCGRDRCSKSERYCRGISRSRRRVVRGSHPDIVLFKRAGDFRKSTIV